MRSKARSRYSSSTASRGVRPSNHHWRVSHHAEGIDPKLVLGVDLEAAGRKVVVYRPGPSRGQFFMAVTATRTEEVERCKADAVARLLLASFSSVRVDRVFTPAEAKELWRRYGQTPALLRIRNTIATDPKAFQVAFVGPGSRLSDTPFVVFRDHASLFVPSIPYDLLETLKAGCTGSSSKQKSPR